MEKNYCLSKHIVFILIIARKRKEFRFTEKNSHFFFDCGALMSLITKLRTNFFAVEA